MEVVRLSFDGLPGEMQANILGHLFRCAKLTDGISASNRFNGMFYLLNRDWKDHVWTVLPRFYVHRPHDCTSVQAWSQIVLQKGSQVQHLRQFTLDDGSTCSPHWFGSMPTHKLEKLTLHIRYMHSFSLFGFINSIPTLTSLSFTNTNSTSFFPLDLPNLRKLKIHRVSCSFRALIRDWLTLSRLPSLEMLYLHCDPPCRHSGGQPLLEDTPADFGLLKNFKQLRILQLRGEAPKKDARAKELVAYFHFVCSLLPTLDSKAVALADVTLAELFASREVTNEDLMLLTKAKILPPHSALSHLDFYHDCPDFEWASSRFEFLLIEARLDPAQSFATHARLNVFQEFIINASPEEQPYYADLRQLIFGTAFFSTVNRLAAAERRPDEDLDAAKRRIAMRLYALRPLNKYVCPFSATSCREVTDMLTKDPSYLFDLNFIYDDGTTAAHHLGLQDIIPALLVQVENLPMHDPRMSELGIRGWMASVEPRTFAPSVAPLFARFLTSETSVINEAWLSENLLHWIDYATALPSAKNHSWPPDFQALVRDIAHADAGAIVLLWHHLCPDEKQFHRCYPKYVLGLLSTVLEQCFAFPTKSNAVATQPQLIEWFTTRIDKLPPSDVGPTDPSTGETLLHSTKLAPGAFRLLSAKFPKIVAHRDVQFRTPLSHHLASYDGSLDYVTSILLWCARLTAVGELEAVLEGPELWTACTGQTPAHLHQLLNSCLSRSKRQESCCWRLSHVWTTLRCFLRLHF